MARSVPWPPSILPKKTVTAPLGAMAIHESSSVGSSAGFAPAAAVCASTSPASDIENATTRAPVPCSRARRESESSVLAFMVGSSRHLVGGALDRAHDRRVGAAAAFETRQSGANFRVGRLFLGVQEGRRRHDPAIYAVAALRDLLFHIGGLQRVGVFGRAQALQRGDLVPGRLRHGRHARARRDAVDMNGAGAALRQAAAEMWVV